MSMSARLTREEESLLKTALAFVVVNSRISPKRALTGDAADTNDPSTRQAKNSRGQANTGLATGFMTPPSILDGLFHIPPTDVSSGTKPAYSFKGIHSSTPQPKFLQSIDDDDHLMNIFRAARFLAKRVLARKSESSRQIKMAAHEGNSCRSSVYCPNDDELALAGTTGHLANQLHHMLVRLTRLPADNLSDASKDIGSATTNSTSKSRHSNDRPQQPLLPKEWIRTSLLESITGTGDNTVVSNSLKEDTLEMLAAYHVYHVMVPQLVFLSPAFVGHIFQFATRLVRDLYDDKFTIPIRLQEGLLQHQRVLDTLATSTLRLMETCWTSKPSSTKECKLHRAFLLNELHSRLLDLVVPVSLQNVPTLYRELATKKKLHGHQRRMEARVLAREKSSKGSLLSARPKYQGHLPKYTLDPGAKVIIRMSIFRLVMRKC
jgi:hypothetical protein